MTGMDDCRALLAEWLDGGHTDDLRARTERFLTATDPGNPPQGFVVARFVDESRFELWEVDADDLTPTYPSAAEARAEAERAGARGWLVFALVEEILTVELPRALPVRVPTTDGGTTVIGAGRLADRPDDTAAPAGPEHDVTEHWDAMGGEVLRRTCSCGESWTHDVERCPADDTAAPDTVVVPRVHLRSWVDFLRALVQQDAIRALNARDAVLDNARQIESWAAGGSSPASTDGGEHRG